MTAPPLPPQFQDPTARLPSFTVDGRRLPFEVRCRECYRGLCEGSITVKGSQHIHCVFVPACKECRDAAAEGRQPQKIHRTPISAPPPKSAWAGEVCQKCGRRDNLVWSVPDVVWNTVVKNRWQVLCPACFDEQAEALGVFYEFDPEPDLIPWSAWLKGA